MTYAARAIGIAILFGIPVAMIFAPSFWWFLSVWLGGGVVVGLIGMYLDGRDGLESRFPE